MKRALLCTLLAAIFVMGFVMQANAAVWNFEKDYLINGPTQIDPHTGLPALDSRRRTGRIFEYQRYPEAYQRGAAGSGWAYQDKIAVEYDTTNHLWRMSNDPADVPQPEGTTGANKYVYLSWWAVDPADANHVVDTANTGASPHGGFTTTSIKCAVCHSVHTAAPGEDAAAPKADTLLRFKASDSCGYCHVAAGSTVVDPVYGGIWPVPAEAGHALATPACSECHASVHGANSEEIPSLAWLMLKTKVAEEIASRPFEGLDYDSSVIERVTAIEASAAAQGYGPEVTGYSVADYESAAVFAAEGDAVRNQAVGIFCGGCHDGSFANTIAGAQGGSTISGTTMIGSPYSGHRTMAAATDNWNSHEATKSSGAKGLDLDGDGLGDGFKIADKPAADCYACHDSYNGFGTGKHAFPHNWGTAGDELLVYNGTTFENQSMVWLLAAADSSEEPTRNGGPMGKQGHAGPNGGTLSDGVCMKCHRWTTGGVGETF